MDADFDLEPDGAVVPRSTRGGKREGAGRKKGYSPKDAARGEEVLDDENVSVETRTAVKKAIAVARKEEALANQAELKFKIDSGEYLSRGAFREASATLLSELAQGLRSLPDTLERKHGLQPAVVQAIEADIDGALARIAEGMELFTGAAE